MDGSFCLDFRSTAAGEMTIAPSAAQAHAAASTPEGRPDLLLPGELRLTPEQFALVCEANPEAVLELAADGQLIRLTPTGGETGARNAHLCTRLQIWARSQGGWDVFDSSTGFRLADGSVLSPDASVVRLERWQALSAGQRRGFPPLCPDLVVELASASDGGPWGAEALLRKLAAYQANGARLGWLLFPDERAVEIWRPGAEPQRLENAEVLEGETVLPGLRLELTEIWAV
jgi:Uma2 family endonuclease